MKEKKRNERKKGKQKQKKKWMEKGEIHDYKCTLVIAQYIGKRELWH